MADIFTNLYKPDVLSCLSDLSNDEVFTPPKIVNEMLDMLPQELFSNPNTTFLDPVCKSGVILREIAKRLLEGLKDIIPDLQERIDHIFKKQLYGIAITELTSLLSRRSVYCSKYPNSEYSITKFDDIQGNIRFKQVKHEFVNKRCCFCGALEGVFGNDVREGMETHAYEFIHTTKPWEIFNMKFDVIIGNPPYQLSFGIEGTNSSNAKSIYNLFINQAIKLQPRYLCMITPSRWMTKTSQGIPEDWVDSMLRSNKFTTIHDFEDAGDCFPGVEIKGGVNYFLWDREYEGKCNYYFHPVNKGEVQYRYDYLDSTNAGVVIRDPKAYKILEKITNVEGEYYNNDDTNFSGLVSPKHFFDKDGLLTSNWRDFVLEKDSVHNIKYYLNKSIHKRDYAWISLSQLPRNQETRLLNKVYIPAAGGSGSDSIVLGTPFIGEAGSVCSQTYLVIGYNPEKHHFSLEECENIVKYVKSRFFRYLVSIKKKTQNGPRGVYQFVPLQDFSKAWTDEELYAKYGLSKDEIDMIESLIRTID